MKRMFMGGAAAALVAFGGAANAAVLMPGGAVAGDPTVTFSGSVLATATGTLNADTFTASFTTSVYRDPGNVFNIGGNNLTFVYTFTDLTGDAIDHFSAYNFAGYLTNVGYQAVAGGAPPLTIDRNTAGSAVNFNFPGFSDVTNGQSSDTLVIQTNATNYTTGRITLSDGSSINATGFQPVGAVPEPGAWALMLGGVGLAGLFLRSGAGRRREDDDAAFLSA